jgi:hypothetical protein
VSEQSLLVLPQQTVTSPEPVRAWCVFYHLLLLLLLLSTRQLLVLLPILFLLLLLLLLPSYFSISFSFFFNFSF